MQARTLRMPEAVWDQLDRIALEACQPPSYVAGWLIERGHDELEAMHPQEHVVVHFAHGDVTILPDKVMRFQEAPVVLPGLPDGDGEWQELRGGEGYSLHIGPAHLLIGRLSKPKRETWSWEVNWPDPDDYQSGRASTREDAMLAAVVSHDRRVAERAAT